MYCRVFLEAGVYDIYFVVASVIQDTWGRATRSVQQRRVWMRLQRLGQPMLAFTRSTLILPAWTMEERFAMRQKRKTLQVLENRNV